MFAVASPVPLALAGAAKSSRVVTSSKARSSRGGKPASSFLATSSSHHQQQQQQTRRRRRIGGSGLERLSVRCAATDDDKAPEGAGDGLSSSFAEELKRRQSLSEGGGEAGGGVPQGGDKWGAAGEDLSSAPRFAKDDGARGVETEQLKKSRALQNEGLEGFPTRAGELLKLGFASFISFGPLIAVFSFLFVGTYLFLGEGGGRCAQHVHVPGGKRRRGGGVKETKTTRHSHAHAHAHAHAHMIRDITHFPAPETFP